jgi:SAM-dependent methyltransferase
MTTTQQNNMQLPQLLINQEQQLGKQGIQLFVACDPSYFHEHAVVLGYSLDMYSPHNSLHFHIFGDDKNVINKIQALKQELKNTSITWSHEGVNFGDKNSRAVYCSCVRFIRLTQLISHFKIPMLSLDADSLIVNSITNLNNEIHDADISLKTRFHAKQVQFKFLTSTVFFKPTQATFSFLQHFSQLIANAITTGKAYWYLDQVSFYQAAQAMPNLKIQDISIKYADWEFNDNSCIWAGKGPRKYKNTKYVKMMEKVNKKSNLSSNYFILPEIDDAEYFIFLQRTDYPKQIEQVLRELQLTKTNPFYIPIRKAILGKLYYDDMYREFETIRSYLPDTASSILDIGCGIAGVDILLHQHYLAYNDCLKEITLLDKEGQSDIYYNFEQEGAYYNSLTLAEKFLRMNGVTTQISVVDILKSSFPSGTFDVIISLISWGFHYPVSTYLDVVYDNMAENGILILDVRKNQNQEVLLTSKFETVKVIHDIGKAQRFLVKKFK